MQDMLPEYIRMPVSESILFSGKAVRVLRDPSSSLKLQPTAVHHPVLRGYSKLQGSLGGGAPQKELFKGIDLFEELLPQSESDKIYAMLRQLKVYWICIFSVCIHAQSYC